MSRTVRYYTATARRDDGDYYPGVEYTLATEPGRCVVCEEFTTRCEVDSGQFICSTNCLDARNLNDGREPASQAPEFTVIRLAGTIDAWGDDGDGTPPFAILVIDNGGDDEQHVEVPYNMITPHPDHLPMFGGEPIIWEIHNGPGYQAQRVLRHAEQRRDPLPPDVVAEITAALERYANGIDETGPEI